MLFSISVITGLLVGTVLLLLTRPRPSAESGTASGIAAWIGLAAGALAVLALAVGLIPGMAAVPAADRITLPASIALPIAALVLCIGSLAMGDRRWVSWLGVAVAALPALFWVAFAVGEIVWPH